MSSLQNLVAGPVLSWMPLLILLFLLVCQPWRMHMPAGSFSQLFGLLSTVLATMGLLLGGFATSPLFWWVLTASHMSWVLSAYHAADNHHYLIGYWCLAVGLALAVDGPEGEQMLSRAAAALIGLCFAVAVAAKLASRAYRDGSFFTWELVSDPRFLPLATFVGALTPELRQQHRSARIRVQSGISSRETAPIPTELRWLAVSLTWWTIGIETAIAVVFLTPVDGPGRLEWIRVVFLATFALTTFTFVAVPSFGQILLLMLLAATDEVTLRWYVVLLALWLIVISFLPHLARRLTLLFHKSKAAQVQQTAMAQQ